MEFVSSAGMKKIDRKAIEKFAIPSLILMENAGRSVADHAERMLGNKSGRVILFCGWGNNGGDGFVAARHLANRGHAVSIYLVGRQKKMSGDTKINFKILNKMKVKINKIIYEKQIGSVIRHIKKARLVIDAVFGIGIKGVLDGFYFQLFDKLNSSHIQVLSIDVPSGLDADTGTASPIAIKAKRTLTMGFPKKGFLSASARKYLGRLVIGDMSLPRQLK